VAILVGSRDHRTQFWKGAIQGPFHQSLLQLAQWFLRRRLKYEMLMDGRRTTDDGRKVMTIAKNGTVYHNIKKIGQSIIILKNGTVYHNIKKM
jgi:hypothetical protein